MKNRFFTYVTFLLFYAFLCFFLVSCINKSPQEKASGSDSDGSQKTGKPTKMVAHANPDSLEGLLKSTMHDTVRLRILDDLSCLVSDEKKAVGFDEQIEALVQKKMASGMGSKKKTIYLNFLANVIHRKARILKNQGEYAKALELNSRSLKIREEINDKRGIAHSYSNFGTVYYLQGDISKALDYNLRALKIREEMGELLGISTLVNNIGLIYADQGDVSKALEYFNRSLKIDEDFGDKKGVSTTLNNIGNIYFMQGDNAKAREYYLKSLKIDEELGSKAGIAMLLTNLGGIYFNQIYGQDNLPSKANRDSVASMALGYFNKSLKMSEELGDKAGIAMALNNIGMIYHNQATDAKTKMNCSGITDTKNRPVKIISPDELKKMYDKAFEYYIRSMSISEEMGDKGGVTTALNNLALIYFDRNETEKSFKCAQKSYALAKEAGSVVDIRIAAKQLEKIYALKGNWKLSRQFYGEYITMRDSVLKEENQKLTQKKYFQYQYEKKAATDSIAHGKAMEIKNLEIRRQEAEGRKQKIVIGFVVFGLLLVLIFAAFIFRSLRITRSQKKVIEDQKALVDEKNSILKQQNEEITSQRDEIEAQRDKIASQRDLVVRQKEHIEEIYHEISDSINYAKRIQEAVLPDLGRILGECNADLQVGVTHFILFRPKNVVSGDFYWATRINEYVIIAVADCTGHGVPGAFMSMLGISFLNEIVRKKEVTKASQVLDQLRDFVVDALKQRGQSGEQKDGMDIGLCVINMNTLELQFAGANNPLWIVAACHGAPLQAVSPDKQPIGIHERMLPFANHVTKLQKGDTIYMMSDGYEDQFGGPDDKKFLSKNLKQLLIENGRKSLDEQMKILDCTIEAWKNDYGTKYEQTDDITVMGIKIGR